MACTLLFRAWACVSSHMAIQLFSVFGIFESSTENNRVGCTIINVVHKWMIGLEFQQFRCTWLFHHFNSCKNGPFLACESHFQNCLKLWITCSGSCWWTVLIYFNDCSVDHLGHFQWTAGVVFFQKTTQIGIVRKYFGYSHLNSNKIWNFFTFFEKNKKKFLEVFDHYIR